jgi:ribosomal protein S7
MLDKRFKKYITVEQRRKFMQVFKQKFSNKEYVLFLRKFRGSMLSKGNRSLSYKLYDYIKVYFKNMLKKRNINLDSDKVFKSAISNLIPVLSTANVRRGRRVETVPVLLKLRKRIVLMNKWLISSQKNKSNVRGVKINDVARIIALLLFHKGNAYDQKMDNLKRAYSARHILLKMGGRRVNKRAFRRLQNKMLEELKIKHGIVEKSNDETLFDSIPTLFNTMIFLKYKRKYKMARIMTRTLRVHLLNKWHDEKNKSPLEKRWLHVWNWIIYFSRFGKRLKLNTKKLDSLKPKYKLVCADIQKRVR